MTPDALLELLKRESPLNAASMTELRRRFTDFYVGFASRPLPACRGVEVAGLPAYWVGEDRDVSKGAILFFHGGGFTIGCTRDHIELCGRLAAATGLPLISFEYRLAPEHRFPAAVQDCLAAYAWMLEQGVDARRLGLAGISAGGNLVATTLLQARDQGMPLPAAGVCMSPAMDIRFPGGSVERNKERDWITRTRLDALGSAYLAGQDPDQPLVSPVHARLAGLPPLLVQAGGHEILLDDIETFVKTARGQGAEVQYQVYDGMFHGWQVFAALLPQGAQAIGEAGAFLFSHLISGGKT